MTGALAGWAHGACLAARLRAALAAAVGDALAGWALGASFTARLRAALAAAVGFALTGWALGACFAARLREALAAAVGHALAAAVGPEESGDEEVLMKFDVDQEAAEEERSRLRFFSFRGRAGGGQQGGQRG